MDKLPHLTTFNSCGSPGSTMQTFFIFLALATGCLAMSLGNSRDRRDVDAVQCTSANGTMANPASCLSYYKCDNNLPTLLNCEPQLVYDHVYGYCVFPYKATTLKCQSESRNVVKYPSICEKLPEGVTRDDAFTVPHPTICNAYFTCQYGYLFERCTFCPQNCIFKTGDLTCSTALEVTANNAPKDCGTKTFVAFENITNMMNSDACWAWSTANKFFEEYNMHPANPVNSRK